MAIDGVYRSAEMDRQMPVDKRFGDRLKRQRRSGLLLSGVVWVTSPCDRLNWKAANRVNPILRIPAQRSTSRLSHSGSCTVRATKVCRRKLSSRSQRLSRVKLTPCFPVICGTKPHDVRREPKYLGYHEGKGSWAARNLEMTTMGERKVAGEHVFADRMIETAASVNDAVKYGVAGRNPTSFEFIRDLFLPLPRTIQKEVAASSFRSWDQAKAQVIERRAGLQSKIVTIGHEIGELKILEDWDEQTQAWEKPVLERNDISRFHLLVEAGMAGKLIDGTEGVTKNSDHFEVYKHVFVMAHDWSAALSGADLSGEWKLPYDLCAFEFRISGRTIIALANEPLFDHERQYCVFVKANDYWYSPPSEVELKPLLKLVWDQIKAACIALDAEVASHEVVRAPTALNEKRAKAGKVAVRDHYLIDLSRRHRIANPCAAKEAGKVRLHFRRGHWRRYEQHKTWIKWQLVGNPDLGFIQRGYKL